jgi:hypothetical protein
VRQIELLRFVLNALERLGIPYAVVGSYASGAWGEPRMTRDIDIVVNLSSGQVASLCDAFPDEQFYVSSAAASEAVARGGQFNVIHPESGNKIDFMVVGRNSWTAAQLDRRVEIDFDADTRGFVAAPEDVILGKLVYYQDGGSEKHLRDIAGILKISFQRVDESYIEQFAAKLGVLDAWQAVKQFVVHN